MATAVMDYLFQRTLDDLVKSLRSQSAASESRSVAKSLEEIRKEIKSTDPQTKSSALHKLLYLSSLYGSDMSWASFQVVEVMSMPTFAHKKIGYSAAAHSFTQSTDVLLLTTNQLRKDLSSKNEYESGLALNCLSRIATPDLARDLIMEIFTLLASSKLQIRKKATLLLLNLFSKHPDSIRVAFKRLVEKLEDPEPQVVTSCVTVLHELARQDPRSILPLAPDLHRLLVESTNNWLCIKVVKLFALLMPLEPRLAKKLTEPLCQQMQRTSAKSLIFECIRTITIGLLDQPSAVRLASEKLKEILNSEDEDPNLTYLGLQCLSDFLHSHPSMVAENKSVIIKCLNDADPSVQRASLNLIVGMISDENLSDTIHVLIRFARTSDKSFTKELVSAILSTCSSNFYELITDFSWYVDILGEICRVPHFEHGLEVERQLVDIGLRVESVQVDLFKLARGLLIDSSLWDNPQVHRALAAAAWISGEYVRFANDPMELVEFLLQPRLRKLPGSVQAVYLQAVLKIMLFSWTVYGTRTGVRDELGHMVEAEVEEGFNKLAQLIKENAGGLVNHVDTEVQERASNLFGLINLLETEQIGEVSEIFMEELGPVSQFAQQRVPVPEGLELLDDISDLKEILGGDNKLLDSTSDHNALFVRKNVAESVVDESSGLLAQHRQKNEQYYLPKDNIVALLDDEFPRAEMAPEAKPMEDDFKVVEESLVWSKPRRTKKRSVVVKLMDEEVNNVSTSIKPKGGLKDSVISTAIRDALSSRTHNGESSFQQQNSHRHRSSRRHKKEQHAEEVDHTQQQENELNNEDVKKSKKHHRRRAKSPLRVAPQAPVVPDFLL